MFAQANISRLQAAPGVAGRADHAAVTPELAKKGEGPVAEKLREVRQARNPFDVDITRRKLLDYVSYEARADAARLDELRAVFPDLTDAWEVSYQGLDNVLTRINHAVRDSEGDAQRKAITGFLPLLTCRLVALVCEPYVAGDPSQRVWERQAAEVKNQIAAWVAAGNITVLVDVVHLLRPLMASRRLHLPDLIAAVDSFVNAAAEHRSVHRCDYFAGEFLRHAAYSPQYRPAADARRAFSEMVAQYATICFHVHIDVVKRELGTRREVAFYEDRFPSAICRLYGTALNHHWFDFYLRHGERPIPAVGILSQLSRLMLLDGLQKQTPDTALPWHWLEKSRCAFLQGNPVLGNARKLIMLSNLAEWAYDYEEGDDLRISPLFDQLYRMKATEQVVRPVTLDLVRLWDERDGLSPAMLRSKIESIFFWKACGIM